MKNTLTDADIRRLARRLSGEANNIPMVTDNSAKGPRVSGRHHWFRWLGKFKTYPGSYQASTRLITVGARWGMRFRHAPSGMAWRWDSEGLCLVRQSDGTDYHPTHSDYAARDFATRVRRAMAANWVARRKVAALAKQLAHIERIKAREIGSTRVSICDSRRAGNCVEGSLAWAESRLGLSRAEILTGAHLVHVAAARLLATGDERAKRAVEAAWARETTISI